MKLKVFDQSKAVVPEKEIFLKLVQESETTVALRMCDALGREVPDSNLLRVYELDGLLRVHRAYSPNGNFAAKDITNTTYIS